jgi:N-acetylglucosamine-6-phosphate deacetylase
MALRLRGTVLRGRTLAAGEVTVGGGVVAAAPEGEVRELPAGWTICAGFVDVQVNGFGGAEVGDDADALAAVAAALPACGVTAFCPTLVTRTPGAYRRAAIALRDPPVAAHAARPLGVHLEGPFLAPTRAGVHDPTALRPPDPAEVDRLLGAFSPAIVTLAPELPGALAAIRRIAAAGCVAAVGHTEADAATGAKAIAAGARLATHALNAMRGIESREPSALIAFLTAPGTLVSLIADGVHVAPGVAAVLARAAGRRLVLVSDAVSAAGAPPGDYTLGARRVVSDGRRVLSEGRLAGSALGIDAGPATLVAAGLNRTAALAAATEAPRRLLGLPSGLAPGLPADLVALDPDLVPRLTVVGGLVAYVSGSLPFAVPEVGAPLTQPGSGVDRGCGGRKRRVRGDSGPHPQGDPSG